MVVWPNQGKVVVSTRHRFEVRRNSNGMPVSSGFVLVVGKHNSHKYFKNSIVVFQTLLTTLISPVRHFISSLPLQLPWYKLFHLTGSLNTSDCLQPDLNLQFCTTNTSRKPRICAPRERRDFSSFVSGIVLENIYSNYGRANDFLRTFLGMPL